MVPERPRLVVAPVMLLVGLALLLPAQAAHGAYTVWTGNGPQGGTVVSMAFAANGAAVLAIVNAGTGSPSNRGWLYRSTDQGKSWSRVGGTVAAIEAAVIATHPTDPEVAWLGDSSGTIWRSENGGETWAAVSALPIAPCQITAAPDAPDVLYASFWNSGTPIYRSDDSGRSWVALENGPRYGWAAAVPGGRVYAGPLMRVSLDRGATWSPLSQGFGGYYDYGVVADPRTPTTVYVYGQNGVFRSDDGGTTWTDASTGLSGSGGPNRSVSVWDFAIDPADSRRLYVMCDDWYPVVNVFRSTDRGASWTQFRTALLSPQGYYSPSLQVGRLVVDPTGSHTVLGGGWSDAGVTRWEGGLEPGARANAGLSPVTVLAIGLDPSDPRRVLAGTGALGLFESVDQGANWRAIPDVDTANVQGLAFAPSDPAVAYAGGAKGVWRSDDGGHSWTKFANFNVCELAVDPFDPDTIIIDPCRVWAIDWFAPQPLSRSRDGGRTWITLSQWAWGEGTLFDPRRPGRVYQSRAGENGSFGASFLRSDDWGDTWTELSTQAVLVLAFDPGQPDWLYGLTYDGQLMFSESGGTSWVPLPSLPGGATAVVSDSASMATLFAASDQGVFMSRDHGSTWTALGTASAPRSAFNLALRSGSRFTLYAAAPATGVKVLTNSPTVRRHLQREALGITPGLTAPPARSAGSTEGACGACTFVADEGEY